MSLLKVFQMMTLLSCYYMFIDMLIVGKDISRIDRLKKTLGESFAMKNFGAAKRILGIHISRDRREKKIYLSQEQYIRKVL